MSIILIVILLLCPSSLVWSQSIFGKYDTNNESHTNPGHYEELSLDSDHTFKYLMRVEFVRINKEGSWSTKGDSLFLNDKEPCCKEKMSVKEGYNRSIQKGRVRFIVSSFEGEPVNYHLVLSNRDSTWTVWSRTGVTQMPVKRLKKFHFIVNSLIFSPEYLPKSRKSNYFEVRLADERLFLNEKWKILNGKIIPLGWDNKYANYYLSKQN